KNISYSRYSNEQTVIYLKPQRSFESIATLSQSESRSITRMGIWQVRDIGARDALDFTSRPPTPRKRQRQKARVKNKQRRVGRIRKAGFNSGLCYLTSLPAGFEYRPRLLQPFAGPRRCTA